ncbi:MAG TPA: hypothetical protein VGC67_00045 [Cellulomonas sp.]
MNGARSQITGDAVLVEVAALREAVRAAERDGRDRHTAVLGTPTI